MTARGDQFLVDRWRRAADDPEIARELEVTFAAIAGEIAARAPSCWASGRCCHFERAGHRLYATGLEAAYTLARAGQEPTRDGLLRAVGAGGCPFQGANLCTVHTVKPVGCRVYFCDTTLGDWGRDLARRMHRRIADLHDLYGVQYHYAEWRSLLRMFISPGSERRPSGA